MEKGKKEPNQFEKWDRSPLVKAIRTGSLILESITANCWNI